MIVAHKNGGMLGMAPCICGSRGILLQRNSEAPVQEISWAGASFLVLVVQRTREKALCV